jgi:hypothetical protein
MSIGNYSAGEATVSAQIGLPQPAKKPPPKRIIYAKGDAVEQPEPR